MLISKEMTEKIVLLFDDIQNWMVENDYECGDVGSQIYTEISEILKEIDPKGKK